MLKVLAEWGLAQVLAKFLRENCHPKLPIFRRSYFFTALLAKIVTQESPQSKHNESQLRKIWPMKLFDAFNAYLAAHHHEICILQTATF